MKLELTKEELEAVISGLEGNIGCMEYLLPRYSIQPKIQAQKAKELEAAKQALKKSEELLKKA
jgi:hypothetical protein